MKGNYPSAEGLAGSVLSAAPELVDPNFRQTLVYIARHDAEGAFGLVLNRPLQKTLGEAVKGDAFSPVLGGLPIFYGGPVRPGHLVMAVFQAAGAPDNVTCRLDVSLEEAETIARSGQGWVRAFAGYSGWGEGQLEGELAENAWRICAVDPVVFEERWVAGLWSLYGHEDQRWRELLPFLPEDPARN